MSRPGLRGLSDAALRYASELGWPIRPQEGIRFDGYCTCYKREQCPPRDAGKHPARNNWQTMATTDAAQIRSWWLLVPYNIATHLTSVAVVDIDSDDDVAHLQRYGPWPVTPMQRSGRGWHLFFCLPNDGESWPVLDALDGRRIETKGPEATPAGGSSITLAPSRHQNGRVYEWVRDPFTTPLAEVPPAFLRHVRAVARARAKWKRRADVLDVTDASAIATLIKARSGRAVRTSNGLGKGAYGLRKTLHDAGADEWTIAAAERAWWRHHGVSSR